jgi:hypothetical protein
MFMYVHIYIVHEHEHVLVHRYLTVKDFHGNSFKNRSSLK